MISVTEKLNGLKEMAQEILPNIPSVEIGSLSYDDDAIQRLIAVTPFVRVCYGGMEPIERESGGAVMLAREVFTFLVGANSARSDEEAEMEVIGYLDKIRATLDGGSLTISGGITGTFGLAGQHPEMKAFGRVIYSAVYEVYE